MTRRKLVPVFIIAIVITDSTLKIRPYAITKINWAVLLLYDWCIQTPLPISIRAQLKLMEHLFC